MVRDPSRYPVCASPPGRGTYPRDPLIFLEAVKNGILSEIYEIDEMNFPLENQQALRVKFSIIPVAKDAKFLPPVCFSQDIVIQIKPIMDKAKNLGFPNPGNIVFLTNLQKIGGKVILFYTYHHAIRVATTITDPIIDERQSVSEDTD